MSTRHSRAAGHRLRNRIAATATAALAVAGIAAGAIAISGDGAPAAEADGGLAVLVGDSLPANPDIYNYLAGKGVSLPDPILSRTGCGTDNRFADAIASSSGQNVQNYTCAGASYRTGGAHVIDQVNEAAANGDIAGATVYMLAGANDTYPYILNDHMPVSEIQENLKNSIADAVRAAKNAGAADVKVLGMPHITNAAGEVCAINLIPDVNVPTFGVNISEVEWAMEQAGIDGAAAGGGRFVSLKAASEGHEMCSNDRYIVGIIDTTSTRRNLPLHMTDEGHSVLGAYAGLA
ncbi:SGNH/GDSL hydrolase family protein [Corynebacterium terpenotabidum]|uniref:Secreted esterase A n=1 Tax=Corynebacterium terpenotabidum Y-11 TaxID=1200352 RepID=S4XDL0_9CORY|nr:secreted esterase A [Corynebacterium terpenotabidum]AGP29675.1 secreted esterase A [Corynebacterium terpenotabidum Y-11]